MPMKQINEQKRNNFFPCPLCFTIHTWEHTCAAQLDPELIHTLEQDIFVSTNVPDCKNCGCERDCIYEVAGFGEYCPDCMLEQYKIEYDQAVDDIVNESKMEDEFR